jgi:hypothetical protein
MPQSPLCGMGGKSMKLPKKPNNYKARNGGWKGVFGMAENGVLAAGIRESCRAFQGACQGFAGAIQAGRIRELWQAVQGSIPLSWAFPKAPSPTQHLAGRFPRAGGWC